MAEPNDRPSVEWFRDDPCVSRWLSGYGSYDTRHGFSYAFYRYIVWVRKVKGADLTPAKLVELNLRNVYESGAVDVATKRQHTDWVIEFVNSEGKNGDGEWIRSRRWAEVIVSAVRSFYRANDSPLFGNMRVPKPVVYERRNRHMTIEQARKIIALLPFREKVVSVIQLKTGMRISEVLHLKFRNFKKRLEAESPLRIDLVNDAGKEYFTYMDGEAAEYLREYLIYREGKLGRAVTDDEYVFIPERGSQDTGRKPLDRDKLARIIYETAKTKGLITETNGNRTCHKSEFKSHGFRHVFKTEAVRAGAELGIPRIDVVVEFFMGHDKGVQEVYDHTSQFHPELFEDAYRKISAYLSLDASKVDEIKIAQKARTDAAEELRDENQRLSERLRKLEGRFEVLLKEKA